MVDVFFGVAQVSRGLVQRVLRIVRRNCGVDER